MFLWYNNNNRNLRSTQTLMNVCNILRITWSNMDRLMVFLDSHRFVSFLIHFFNLTSNITSEFLIENLKDHCGVCLIWFIRIWIWWSVWIWQNRGRYYQVDCQVFKTRYALKNWKPGLTFNSFVVCPCCFASLIWFMLCICVGCGTHESSQTEIPYDNRRGKVQGTFSGR